MNIRLLILLFGAMALGLAARAQTTVGPITYGSGQNVTVIGPATVQTSGNVVVSGGANVKFLATSSIALNAGFSSSGSTFQATVDTQSAIPLPTFSPAPGTYPAPQSVTLTDATSDATIYYTTDGSVPTPSSAAYAGPISLPMDTTTVNAIAVNSAGSSPVASGSYTISTPPSQAAAPSFSPGAGTYTSAQTVTISTTTSGAIIRYTTNGSAPNETNGTVYSSPVLISATTTLQAIAYASGFTDSSVASGSYTINTPSQAVAPSFSPGAGSYTSAQTVKISTTTSGASIRYTTDGSKPSETNGTVYSSPVSIGFTTTLQAIAYASGFTDSGVTGATYTINLSFPQPPLFTPGSGTYPAPLSVTITDATSGATIYYTTNGSTPTFTMNGGILTAGAGTTQYKAPIVLLAGTTPLNAIAVNSIGSIAVTTSTYTAYKPPLPAPSFSPGAGSYTSAQSVIITDTASGITIRYTTDGSTPSETNGTVYSAAVSISATTTLQAIAVDSAGNQSATSGTYTISPPSQVAAPSFSPRAGTYASAQTVTISTTTSGASIRYTTDASTPSETNGTVYSGPVSITATMTLQAIAYASSFTDSSVTSGSYTISTLQSQVDAPTFSPGAGTYTSAQTVTISSTTSGASIRYTTDGSTPSETAGTIYSGSVSITATTTLQAIAYASGFTDSSITSGNYTVNLAAQKVPPAPVFNPPGQPQVYTAIQSTPLLVTISDQDSDPRVTIYYTTDSTTPEPNSSPSCPSGTQIPVPADGTQYKLQAIAVNSAGDWNGLTTTCFYTVTSPEGLLPTPQFAPPGGSGSQPASPATDSLAVTITDTDKDTSVGIYYTTDGTTTPTASSPLYTGPVLLPEGKTTIMAVALDGSGDSSTVARASYTVDPPSAIVLACGLFNSAKFYTADPISYDIPGSGYVLSGTLAGPSSKSQAFQLDGENFTLADGMPAYFTYDADGNLTSVSGTLGDPMDSTGPNGSTIHIPALSPVIFGVGNRTVTFSGTTTYTVGGETFTFAGAPKTVSFTPTSITGTLTPGQSFSVNGGTATIYLAAAPATFTSSSVSGTLASNAYLSLYGYNIWFTAGPVSITANSFTGTLLNPQTFLVDGGIPLPLAAGTLMTITGTSVPGTIDGGYNIAGTLAGDVQLPFYGYTLQFGPGPVNVTNNSLTGTLASPQTFEFDGINLPFAAGTSLTVTGNSISGTVTIPLSLPFNGYTVNYAAGPVTFIDVSSTGIGNSISGTLASVESFPINGATQNVTLAAAPATFTIVSISKNIVSTNITGILSGAQSFPYNGGQRITFADGKTVTLNSNSISGTLANPLSFSLNGQTVYLAAAPITIAGYQYISSGTLADSAFQSGFKVSYGSSSVTLTLAPNTTATFSATTLLSGTLKSPQTFTVNHDGQGGIPLGGSVSVTNGGTTVTGTIPSLEPFDFDLGLNKYGQTILNSSYFLPGTAVVAIDGTTVEGTLAFTTTLYSGTASPGETVQAGTSVTFLNGAYEANPQ